MHSRAGSREGLHPGNGVSARAGFASRAATSHSLDLECYFFEPVDPYVTIQGDRAHSTDPKRTAKFVRTAYS